MERPYGNWIAALALDALPEGGRDRREHVAGRDIALYEVDGAVYASDNICTHGHARLSDGFLEGREIECPLHQGKFDVCSGRALCAPLTEDIRTYPVKIEDGKVFLHMP